MLYNLVENHFKTISKLRIDRNLQKFRSSIVPLTIVNRLINKLSEDPSVMHGVSPSNSPPNSSNNLQKFNFHNAAFLITRVLSHRQKILSRKQRLQIKQCDKYKQKMGEYEDKSMKLEPKIENRIVCIRDQEVYISN